MDFEQWLAVLALLVPLTGQLAVLFMLRRDVNRVMFAVDKHEDRLDNHDLVFTHVPGGREAVVLVAQQKSQR